MGWKDQKGLAPLFIILVLVLVVVVVIGGVSYFVYKDSKQIVPVADGACRCKDLKDMESRIAEATAPVAAYTQMIAARSAADSAAGSPTMFTNDGYEQGRATVQAAVNAAHVPGGGTGTGTTDTACVTRVNAKTECLRAALQTHENIHAASCLAAKQSGRVGKYADYKESMPLTDYWREEIKAYSEEITYLGRHLAQAKADPACVGPVAIKDEKYPDAETKQDLQEHLAAAWRRVANYAKSVM